VNGAPRAYRRYVLLAVPTPRLTPSRKAVAQVGMVIGAYLLYSAARWVTVGDLATAQGHAEWILGLEQSAGVAVEKSVQVALEGTWVLWLLNHFYLAAQLVVVPGALVFLYRRSRPLYARLRNTILATWLLSVPVYAAFPVAPPRLADVGLVDTITHQTGFAMDSKLTTSFYNELAAVPSLHVGFAVAVVATGNHFVFDIAAGLLASALGYGAGRLVARAGAPPASPPLRPCFADS
jgi:PAP2 superfamily